MDITGNLTGKLLIAMPGLADPNFHRTVVLICAHNEEGAFGVVINRDGVGDQGVEEYCAAEDIPILMRLPIDRRIAIAYSEGTTIVEALPEYRERFAALWERMKELTTGS